MRSIRSLLVLCAAVMSIASARIAGDPKAELDAAIQQATRLIDAGKFREAKARLKGTLVQQAEHAYARECLPAIERLLTQCAFSLAHPQRSVQELFCGEVSSFDSEEGSIEVRYKKSPKSKSKAGKDPALSAEGRPCSDFELKGGVATWKLPFQGPHSIEIKGQVPPESMRPVVHVGIGQPVSYFVDYDPRHSATLTRVTAEARGVVQSWFVEFKPGRPYTIKVDVEDTFITAYHDGRHMAGLRDAETHGRIGFSDFAKVSEIVVSGAIDPAWVRERLDTLTQADFAAFEKTYDVRTELPESLRGR